MRAVVLLLIVALALSEFPKQRPVIGIYTQSIDSNEPTSQAILLTNKGAFNQSYISASYVKYVQMSGAQVIPIFAYSNQTYFDNLLPKINGVLFPGGDVDININNKWTQNADYIFKYAMKENDKGNIFPIWGTCLGMQLLAYLTAGYDAKAIAPVRGEVAIRNSISIQPQNTLFKDLSENLLTRLQYGQGILYFNHHFAVTKSYYDASKQLRQFWNVQAYTTTPYSEDFLSVFKAKNYPFYGVQFHPQKNLFEWKVYADRSDSGAEIVQILSNKFVQFARQSNNNFSNDNDFWKLSIYNYKTSATTMSFVRIYIFNENTANSLQTKPILTKQD